MTAATTASEAPHTSRISLPARQIAPVRRTNGTGITEVPVTVIEDLPRPDPHLPALRLVARAKATTRSNMRRCRTMPR